MQSHVLMEDHKFVQFLLGRECPTIKDHVKGHYMDKVVMVTGGGGSIGSYLCEMLASCKVKTLIVYEHSEFNLYVIEHKLRRYGVHVVPVLGDVRDFNSLNKVMETYQVDMIFHAAAYKHVPMVERNPVQGFAVNVTGTRTLVEVARKHKVKDFLLVSTDKAVNPTNIMGATKRLAEAEVLAGDIPNAKVVRFGNVLGSSGSVIPLFLAQLKAGKPVTLTHKDVTRYFMSVMEACALILTTGTRAIGGVHVFDMKEPVSIEAMIHRLSEYLSIDNYTIKEIGLRPGEKLYEELTLGSGLELTEHEGIMYAAGEVPVAYMRYHNDLYNACRNHDIEGLRTILQNMGMGYVPDAGIVDDLWLKKNVADVDTLYGDANSYIWVTEQGI